MKPLSFSPDGLYELSRPGKQSKKQIDYDKLAEEEGLREPEFIPGRGSPYSFDENVDDFESSDYDRDDYTRERDEYVDGG